ncbi:MAG: hypothetical protein PHU25_13005 [Deltaproteobacteria bacterium]|nr:hypothetical protein [Deltaproteobacteria bacterium]
MLHAIRERVRIKLGGVIEIRRSDLPEGQEAEVIVMLDDFRQHTGALKLPVYDVGPWPSDFSARREEMYGNDGR